MHGKLVMVNRRTDFKMTMQHRVWTNALIDATVPSHPNLGPGTWTTVGFYKDRQMVYQYARPIMICR